MEPRMQASAAGPIDVNSVERAIRKEPFLFCGAALAIGFLLGNLSAGTETGRDTRRHRPLRIRIATAAGKGVSTLLARQVTAFLERPRPQGE